jgi:hypothetical protein
MDAVVETRQGTLRGTSADGVSVFKGIPFTAPPFGANRLRPPQPVEPWRGVRDALAFGPKAPQMPYPPKVALILPALTGPGDLLAAVMTDWYWRIPAVRLADVHAANGAVRGRG